MSNHYHVILFLNHQDYSDTTPQSVVARWHKIHRGTDISHRFANGEPLEPHERQQLDTYIDLWKERLFSISWFMRVINEKIARMANAEDEVSGRFWEGRYKCQALLDEKALLTCMAYVDLNPVRAAIAETPETSAHTSIKRRSESLTSVSTINTTGSRTNSGEPLKPTCLHPFAGNPRLRMPAAIPFNLIDYLELVDWTGRQIREGKKGIISAETDQILNRLAISPEHWIYLCQHFESQFKGIVGSINTIKSLSRQFGYRRTPNLSSSRLMFSTS